MLKKNLMTLKDSKGCYDLLECEECGYQIKWYKLERPRKCLNPKCKTNQLKPNICGGWADTKASFDFYGRFCHYCNSKAIEVPKEGHPNSKYWSLKRTPDF